MYFKLPTTFMMVTIMFTCTYALCSSEVLDYIWQKLGKLASWTAAFIIDNTLPIMIVISKRKRRINAAQREGEDSFINSLSD